MVNIDVNDFISINFDILRPANEVCEDYVFTGVCLSKGVSASGPGRGVFHTPWADTPPGQTSPGQTPLWTDIPTWVGTTLGRHPPPG